MPFSNIIGHETVIRRLRLTFQRDRVPSAYMFVGSNGIGKTGVVKEFAKLMNCRTSDNCGRCDNCKLFDGGAHPDFYLIKPTGRDIRISQIKTLIGQLNLKPGYASKRVVLIKNAHQLNREAANSLLKLLEEPPLNTLLVLTAVDENLLPETILSRCQKIFFAPLSRDQLRTVISDNFKLKPEEIEFVLNYSSGSVRKKLVKKVSPLINLRSQTLEILLNLTTENMIHYFYLLEQWTKKDLHLYFLEFCAAWIRDFICVESGISSKLINRDMVRELDGAQIPFDNECLHWCFDLTISAETAIKANAAKALALESMLIQIKQIREGVPII